MREGPAVLGLLLAFLLAACEGVPTAEIPPVGPTSKENVVLDGDLVKTMSLDKHPQFEGYVKNIGKNTVYDCRVEISCFYVYTKAAESLIDIATGSAAESGDIPPGGRASFIAVASRLDSHNQYAATSVLILWREK